MSEIHLSSKQIQISQPWLLEDLEADDFAKGEDLIQELKNIYDLRVGDRPIVRSLRKLYEFGNKALPPAIGSLKGEAYLVTHAIGVNASKDPNRIDRVGYKAWFDGYGTTIELLPNTRFKEYFSAGLKFAAGIAADGYAKTPEFVGELTKEIINLGVGAELNLSAEANIVGKLTLSLKSTKIQSVGNASSTITWQFDKDENPLVGDQVMIQTLVVPKEQKKVKFNLQGFVVIDLGDPIFVLGKRHFLAVIGADHRNVGHNLS